jgi:hypothetical protein
MTKDSLVHLFWCEISLSATHVGTQFRESDYGLVTREFEGVADEFIVAAVMAAGAVTAIRPDSSTSVDKANTATAVASFPVANNPETQPIMEKETAATTASNKES